jgi:hypothetical protein
MYNTKAPRSFALRPLYQELMNRNVTLIQVNEDGSLSEAAQQTQFTDVDVEMFARRLLCDIDLFLTAPYVNGIYDDTNAQPALQKIMALFGRGGTNQV